MTTILLILTLLQSAQDVYKSANTDFDAGRWPEAASKYEQVLKEDPAHIPSLFNLAVCLTKTGKIDEAIGAYRTLLDKDGTIFEAHLNLAILLDQTGRRAEAGEQFENALAMRPEDGQAQFNLAMFYVRGDDLGKAHPLLITLANKGPAALDVYIALSDAEHARKNEVKSREYLQKAIELDPKNANLVRNLAISYLEANEYEKAVPVLEQLTKAEPSNPEYLYMLGKSYQEMKAYPQAIATLTQMLRIKPDAAEAWGRIGDIFNVQKDWTRAAQALSRMIELRPRDALPHFVLATCLDNLGNAKEAIVQYNEFLKLDDGSNDARSFQARERARTLDRRLKR